MDSQLQRLKRQLASGEKENSPENYNRLKRVCPYSQKSVEIALKILKATPWEGGAIGVYLTERGWNVKGQGTVEHPDIPTHHQAIPPLTYREKTYKLGSYSLAWIQWNLRIRHGSFLIQDIDGNYVENSKLGILWHQRDSRGGAIGSWVKPIEQHIISWAKKRAQFAWYYGLK